MLLGYSSLAGVLNSSSQAKLHQERNPGFSFVPLKEESSSFAADTEVVSEEWEKLTVYVPRDTDAFLMRVGLENLKVIDDEYSEKFDKVLATLQKFGHIHEKDANATRKQRAEWLIIGGIAVRRKKVSEWIMSQSKEEMDAIARTSLAEPIMAENKETSMKPTVEVDINEIRRITGFSFSPFVKHENKNVFIPWKKKYLECQAKMLLLLATRQAGKTHDTAELCVEKSFLPGHMIIVASVSIASTDNLLRYFKSHIRNFPEGVFVEDKQKRIMKNTISGSEVHFRTAGTMKDADNIRGMTADLLICDEAWLFEDGIFDEVLEPTLDARDGSCIMLTTVRKERNWFFRLLADVRAGRKPDSEVIIVPYTENPFLPPRRRAEIKSKEHLPHIRREYMCEITASESAMFSPSFTKELPMLSECGFAVAYDPARKHDRAGYSILAVTPSGMRVNICADEIPLTHKDDWGRQREFMDKVINSLPSKPVFVMDVTGVGDGVAKIFSDGGITVDAKIQYTQGTVENDLGDGAFRIGKSMLINGTEDSFEQRELLLYEPMCVKLKEEISYAERKVSTSGLVGFESPFFDDIINANMMADWAARKFRPVAVKKKVEEKTLDFQTYQNSIVPRKIVGHNLF